MLVSPALLPAPRGTGEQGDFDPAAWSSTRVGGYLGSRKPAFGLSSHLIIIIIKMDLLHPLLVLVQHVALLSQDTPALGPS